MAVQVKYCPHCGAKVGRDAYTGAAVCFNCDSVWGWEATTLRSAPGTDRRRARMARIAEVIGATLTLIFGVMALFALMFV